MGLIILIILTFLNGRLANRKGRSFYGWSALTIVACILFVSVIGSIYLMAPYKGEMTQQGIRSYMLQVQQQPIKVFTLLLIGVGGGLLVRFILEKLPIINVNRRNFPDDGNFS